MEEEPLTVTATRAGIDVPADPVAEALAKVVAGNRRRAGWLVLAPSAAVLVLCLGVGVGLGAILAGLSVGVVLSIGAAVGLWRGAPRLVLGALGVRPADEEDVPGPFSQLEGLCATMGLPVPALYVADEPIPDALAVGRGPKDGALVLTTGLLGTLDPVGLEAVLAHELAHLKRHDTAPATVGAALALMSGAGGSAAGRSVHRMAGRGREFEADRHAVSVTRYPPGLRQALAAMAAAGEQGGTAPVGSMAGNRSGQVLRWLFTVSLPERNGRVPEVEDHIGELDAPSVRIAALDEW